MDHDIMGSHVQRLLEFKKRVEAMIDGAAQSADTTVAEELGHRIDGLDKTVSGLSLWMEGIAPRIDALQSAQVDASAKLDSVSDVLAWFAANRDGLEALLSLGDGLASKPATIEGTVISSATSAQADPAPAAASAEAPLPVPQPTSAEQSAAQAEPELDPQDKHVDPLAPAGEVAALNQQPSSDATAAV